jgi:hypothetical protein
MKRAAAIAAAVVLYVGFILWAVLNRHIGP